MDTMERDPKYIAETVKLLRKMFSLTQDNLASMANLTTRTIEKIESGRHTPNEQTLRSICRALNLNMDLSVFDKPTPDEEKRWRINLERAIRKTIPATTAPVHTAKDFLNLFDQRHAFRFVNSDVEGDEAMEVAAAMVDWIRDANDIWDDVGQVHRLEFAREFVGLCEELERHGYVCHMGHHRQRLREKDRPDLLFEVGVMALLPKDESDGERYFMIQLDGAWEALEQDRVQVPEEWSKPAK